MAKKEFQAESKKLMDMMINSIYTNKEIFLRELISNASDAIDKLYYKSLTDTSVGMNKSDFRILITRDKENRILTVEDNGIGMTKAELEENLGTIAHSGSLDFKQDNKDENIDIIGQFGVGFYSSFMVADKVTVISKAYGSDEAWQWESSGVDGYEMTPAEKDTAGTQIILHIKPDTETDHYDNFLDEYGIVAIVKKYSDYVRYPIQMEREKSRQKPEPDPKPEDYKPEWETYTELETLNSMIPIWKKQKSEVTDEEYNAFYKDKFGDYADPARVIVSRTEGTANYNALLFVPSHRPYDFYTKEYEKGLALYASGVLIMEKCAEGIALAEQYAAKGSVLFLFSIVIPSLLNPVYYERGLPHSSQHLPWLPACPQEHVHALSGLGLPHSSQHLPRLPLCPQGQSQLSGLGLPHSSQNLPRLPLCPQEHVHPLSAAGSALGVPAPPVGFMPCIMPPMASAVFMPTIIPTMSPAIPPDALPPPDAGALPILPRPSAYAFCTSACITSRWLYPWACITSAVACPRARISLASDSASMRRISAS